MILQGDCLSRLSGLPDESVQVCVTSPPYYGLRDYGWDGQIGLEKTPEEFIAKLVEVFREVKRVLKDDGTLWVNIGDSYAQSGNSGCAWGGKQATNRGSDGKANHRNTKIDGCKPKDLIGIPWMLAFALRSDGWYLRSDIIWHKPNPMPESVTDRPTKAHEYLFLLSKSQRYYYDADTLREPAQDRPFDPASKIERDATGMVMGSAHNYAPGASGYGNHPNGRNARSVWSIATKPYTGAHFAVFPEEIPKRCILAGSKPGDVVLDPFAGSGTTGAVAVSLGRQYVLIEGNPKYLPLIEKRMNSATIGMPMDFGENTRLPKETTPVTTENADLNLWGRGAQEVSNEPTDSEDR